jgi:phosphatidylethanolamine/phosphatidyl-N-methylethanolamine N-methyltransferase
MVQVWAQHDWTGDTVTARNDRQPRRLQRNGALAFFLGFLRNPNMVASLVPSSRFLERRIVEAGAIAGARLVVELGPGTGGTTRALLAALPADARLLVVELNPRFAELLRVDADPRLIVHEGSAEDLPRVLAAHGLGAADVVVSGIPFSTMPPDVARRIILEIWQCLAPGGRFVAYQVRRHVAEFARERFGEPRREFELRNAPPIRVYNWRKLSDSACAN